MKTYTLLVFVALVGALHASRVVRRVPLSTGHFSGRQLGNAFTKVNSDTDTRTGITNAALEGILANSGQLRGATDALDAYGGKGRSAYAGDMCGRGGLWSDTMSRAGLLGQMARSGLIGYLNRGGGLAGSIGAGFNRH